MNKTTETAKTINDPFSKIYDSLLEWCAARDFAGSDPFDGLNSRIFQGLPFKNNALARLAFLQTVKRAPFDLRKILSVSNGINSKGIALFALAELSRFRATKNQIHAANATFLLDKLVTLKIRNPQSAIRNRTAFGYNFDWQSRAFFAPRGTPTIVPTAFAARAFFEAYQSFGDEIYLTTLGEICEFIVTDLNRSFESEDEICFSYTPLDNSTIFNASLLAGETLASFSSLIKNDEYEKIAVKTANFVVRRQLETGAWAYGTKLRHKWIDNFHTAFILLSLRRMQDFLPELTIENSVTAGYEFWTNHFFLADGAPKYYENKIYPFDIHSAAAAIIALCELKNERSLPLANRVAEWTTANLRDESGFFYYQKHRFYTVKTPMMRWAQAWMSLALARLLEHENLD